MFMAAHRYAHYAAIVLYRYEHFCVRRNAEPAPCLGAVRHVAGTIEQRMPHERRVDPVRAEKRFLERQDHRRLRDDARHRLHSAGT